MNIDQLSNLFLEEEKNLNNLFSVLKKYKLQYLLPGILKNLEKKQVLLKNRKKVVLEIPFETKDEIISEIGSKYGEKISDIKIDKSIVTGFKLKTKDKIIDSSLKALFKNFTK